MAYTPTTWNDGDVITAEKLNKLEQGVENEQVGPQGPAGATGAKGDKGDKGDPGEDGTTIDTVTVTVDNNTGTPTATGSISGTTLTLDFKNLKGAKGDKGDTGAAGAKGDTGATGAKGDAGAAGADGKSVTAIKLTTTDGAVTGGEATLSDGSKITITVSEEGT